MKTLLTPTVLHESVLSTFPKRDKSFLVVYAVAFAAVQTFIGMLVYTLFFLQTLLPFGVTVGEYADKVLVNANFTKVSVSRDSMQVDIRPEIWTFSLEDSNSKQILVAVDSLGSMNKKFWDDRFIGGETKKIYGVGFMKDHLYLKYSDKPVRLPYSVLGFGKNSTELSKGEIYQKTVNTFSKKNLFVMFAFSLLPMSFLFFVTGIVLHGGFALVMASFIYFFVKGKESFVNSFKVSLALYVVWAYCYGLLAATQMFLSQSFIGPLPLFFSFTRWILFFGLAEIGIQQLRGSLSKVSKKKEL